MFGAVSMETRGLLLNQCSGKLNPPRERLLGADVQPGWCCVQDPSGPFELQIRAGRQRLITR